MNDSRPEPATDTLDRVRELISMRTGIEIHSHQQDKFVTAVRDTCEYFEYSQTHQLLGQLLSRENSPEQERLVAGITVGESYFFRDDDQIRFLRNSWLPALIDRRRASGHKLIRIWSAGCSAGQELYTVAILLHELLDDIDSWHIHLLGTDINTRALSEAVRGIYSKWSLRNTPEPVKSKYFTRHRDGYRVSPQLRHQVKFAYLNLVADGFPSILTETVALDLVLCRNVFIYFEPSRVAEILARFSACLVSDGIIVLGASDIVENPSDKLALKVSEDMVYYKYSGRTLSGGFVGQDTQDPEDYRQPPARIRLHSSRKRTRHDHHDRHTHNTVDQSDHTMQAPGNVRESLLKLSRNNDWKALVQLTRQDFDTDPVTVVYRAWALANLGNLQGANELIQSCMDDCNTLPETQYVHAMIRMDMNHPEEAGTAMRKAVFLERNFPEAHYRLGLLQLRNGEYAPGMKSLRNALSLTSSPDTDALFLLALNEATVKRFSEILSNEIDIYSAVKTRTATGAGHE